MSRRAADFLQFAMRLYCEPGMKEACLTLQERHGLNVNCLLLAAWAARLGHAVDSDGWRELERTVETIRKKAIEPIRAVRRQISRETKLPEDLRAPIKRLLLYAELRAEQAEERLLHDRLARVSRAGEPGEALFRANLAAYAEASPGLERFASLVVESVLFKGEFCHSG